MAAAATTGRDPLAGGPVARTPFRTRVTSAMHAGDEPSSPGPWEPALRDAVLDAVAADDWRDEYAYGLSRPGRVRLGSRNVGPGSALRDGIAQQLARRGVVVDLPTIGAVMATLTEGEIRRRRAERARARAMARWPHLGDFAPDMARVVASRARARRAADARRA